MKEITCSRSSRLLLTLLFSLTLILSSLAFGQSTTEGAIGGTVVDPQDKVVAGATVTVKNLGSNLKTSVKTDAQGYYRVGQLAPATYEVAVKAEGFAPYRAEKVIVTVGSLTGVSPHLTIGTTEQVDVTAETPLINVTSADFAPTFNESSIENLPINGGRWTSFVMLTPGVVSDSSGFGLVSFRGMSTLLNNVTVDGADNNQAYFSEERGRTRAGYSTAKVAVQEFQVNTSNYSAEYGRAAGGVINTVTKSGTNQIHGEAFWYDRDNTWGSFNPFTTLAKASNNYVPTPYKPIDVRKMGGLGIGGPIVKDKAFWFVGYDRFHRNFPGTAVPNSASSFFGVPTIPTNLATGYCSGTSAALGANYGVCQMAAEVYHQSTSASNMAAITPAQYTTQQQNWNNFMFGNGTQLGLASITGPTPRTGDQDIFFPKLDWIVDQKNHASFEVNRMRWWSPAGIQTQGTNAYGIDSFGNDYVKDTWGVAKWDTLVSNNISNQVRVQVGRDFEFETNQNPSPYEQQTLLNGANNPYGLPPNVTVSSFQWGTPAFLNRKAYPDEYKTQIADTITVSKGQHNLRFGIDFVNSNDKINNLYEQYGSYSFSGLPTYFAQLADPAHLYYSTYYQEFQGTTVSSAANNNPVQTYRFSTEDWALFAQDDWKLTRRLTVNAGLRFETEVLPGTYDNMLTSVAIGNKTISPGSLPAGSKNWGPRVGFAWDTFGDGKTVLRGGYGMYFGRVINSTLFTGMTTTGSPNGQNAYTFKTSSTGAPSFPKIDLSAPTGATGTLSLDYFDPKFKSPQVHEIDLTLQRQLPGSLVLSVSYLGSFGRHLPSFNDINLAAPGTPYCSATKSGIATGAQGGTMNANGSCSSGVPVTPPSTIAYTLSNGSDTGMPLANGKTYNLPFYTSRPNFSYGTVTDIFSGVNSSYNALAVQLEKRLSHHVQLSANYTWSHALDFGMNNTTGAGTSNFIDPRNPKFGMYGNSLTNVPNRFTFNAILQAPWQNKGWLKYAVDGWQAAPMVQIQNGLGNTLSLGTAYPTQYVGTSEFQSIAGGLLGAGGSYQIPGTERNGYRQPNTYVFDARLSKVFPIYEQYKLEFSADGFNLFNHTNVTGVSATSAYTLTNPTAGVAGSTTTPALGPYNVTTTGASEFNVPSSANSNFVYSTRQIQLGLRLTF